MLLVNVVTFLTFGFDKDAAYKNKRQIPERTLFVLALFGGTVGGLLGMKVFHHKTSKTSFLILFYGIVTLQFVLLYFGLDYLKRLS